MVKIGAQLPKLSQKIKLGIRFWTTMYITVCLKQLNKGLQ